MKVMSTANSFVSGSRRKISDAEFNSKIVERTNLAIASRYLSSKSKGENMVTKKKLLGIVYTILGIVVIGAIVLYMSIAVTKGNRFPLKLYALLSMSCCDCLIP